MVEVTQGEQKRWFKYDSLGRLIRVRQPEQEINPALNLADEYNTSGEWTAGFTYDVLGNVLTATDANGVTITNTYDRAGRVKTRNYSGEPAGQTTPGVSFFYDGKGLAAPQSPNYTKGKLTRVTSSVSETQYALFDNFGRLKESRQITDGNTYTSKYTYNFAGALAEEEYPSGRKVKNEFESDGDLARIYGTANPTSTERTYATSFSYTPDGRIARLRLGNGLWEAAKFNTRLQVTELALGHGVNSGDLWKLGYEYGELNTDGTVNGAKNTGNIAKQTLSFNGLAQPFIQTYKYDSLYRLTEAKETNNGDQTWKQNFTNDRYGNRLTHDKFIGTTQIVHDNLTHPTIDPNTNRFTAGQGYSFDKNGNLVADPENRAFTFNGDNKQSKVVQNGQTVGEYFYDGEGKRVKKKVFDAGVVSEETIFVYSNGKLIAEYSTKPPPQNPTTNYTVTDQLGSPRLLVNSLGEVVSRRDFMPFGEEIYPDGTHRTANLKYTSDGVRQKFTGYQKDEETHLDFAEARMYENRHGRFTAVDPLLSSGKSADPQTFNRYVYVLNNPLVLIDPDGLQVGTASGAVYRNGRGFAIFAGRGSIPEGYSRVRRTIKTTTSVNGVDHHVTVRSNGWTIGDRVDNAKFSTPTPPTRDQGDSRFRDLIGGFNRGFDDSISGAGKGATNFGIGLANTVTDELTGGRVRSFFGVGNPLEIQRYSYHSLTEAKFGSGTEIGLMLGTLKAGNVFGGGTSSLSVVPEVAPSAPAAVHGNSLNSLRPTWGYRLFHENGTFLKNGITSQVIPEARYTQRYMADKFMPNPRLFPNRREARMWEFERNTVSPGPLNIRR